jgi:hypothetical protein
MFNIEVTRFNLYVLANGIDYLTLVNMKESLTDVKKSMERSKNTLIELTFEFGQNVEAIVAIEKQLEIINHNLDAVSKAVLMKEAEPFEHWQEFEALELHNFCLN